MSATGMPSGRGRLAALPGMGSGRQQAPAPAPEPDPQPATAPEDTTGTREPAKPRTQRRRSAATSAQPHSDQAAADGATTARTRARAGIDGPYAGERKLQVNPRVFESVWRYYEDLVDALPRGQRRGALTALVNAVLAQHAPTDVKSAQEAIAWVRQAEARTHP